MTDTSVLFETAKVAAVDMARFLNLTRTHNVTDLTVGCTAILVTNEGIQMGTVRKIRGEMTYHSYEDYYLNSTNLYTKEFPNNLLKVSKNIPDETIIFFG